VIYRQSPARHVRRHGLCRVLNDANPARAFDCAQAFGSIAIAAGEHDSDDTRAESLGRRLEERISGGLVEVDLGTRIEHALAGGLHCEATVRGR